MSDLPDNESASARASEPPQQGEDPVPGRRRDQAELGRERHRQRTPMPENHHGIFRLTTAPSADSCEICADKPRPR